MSNASVSIIILTLGFIAWQFIAKSTFLPAYFERKCGHDRAYVYKVYFQQLFGVLLYGVLPVAWLLAQGADFQQFGIKSPNIPSAWWIALGLGSVALFLNYFIARSADNLALYPQIRLKRWGKGVFLGSAFTWAAYLLAYEFLFRGFMLFACEREMGRELAIVINISLYALVHVPKGWKEAVGCLPMGLILCHLTLWSGSFFPAVLVHVGLAWGNEWFSLRYHPEITVKLFGK